MAQPGKAILIENCFDWYSLEQLFFIENNVEYLIECYFEYVIEHYFEYFIENNVEYFIENNLST